jgi:hypothetical protein
LISEYVDQGSEEELIEIINLGPTRVALEDVYLADTPDYYALTQATPAPTSDDFVIRFPAGAELVSGGRAVVSLSSATAYAAVYGGAPDYDLDGADSGAPAMRGVYTSTSGLAAQGVDKTGVTVGAATYADDTNLATQAFILTHNDGFSTSRCDSTETTEAQSGGNGIAGADETSEDFSAAFVRNTDRTPGAANDCPPS